MEACRAGFTSGGPVDGLAPTARPRQFRGGPVCDAEDVGEGGDLGGEAEERDAAGASEWDGSERRARRG